MNFSGKIFIETIYQKEYKNIGTKTIPLLGEVGILEHPTTKHKVFAKSLFTEDKAQLK